MQRDEQWMWVIVGLLVLLGGGGTAVAIYNQTRGLRNNNPGNIRHSSTVWQGQATQQNDASFVTFVSPEYGIRALAKVLQTYFSNGYDTVEEIISRWAPPTENDTGAYIRNVANALGVSSTAPLSPSTAISGLVSAIIRQENGIQPYSSALLNKGIALA